MAIDPVTENVRNSDDMPDDAFFGSVDDAIGKLAADFAIWARDDLAGVLDALDAAKDDPEGRLTAAKNIFTTMHDIKGQAGTFGYDLLAEIAESACDFGRNLTVAPTSEQAAILRLHVVAAQFVVGRNIKGDDREVWDQFRTKRDAMIEKVGAGPENDLP
jgi:chemotaxis protein histidine kinase CheA